MITLTRIADKDLKETRYFINSHKTTREQWFNTWYLHIYEVQLREEKFRRKLTYKLGEKYMIQREIYE